MYIIFVVSSVGFRLRMLGLSTQLIIMIVPSTTMHIIFCGYSMLGLECGSVRIKNAQLITMIKYNNTNMTNKESPNFYECCKAQVLS